MKRTTPGLDAAMVRQHYQKMSDAELIRFATYDASGLSDTGKDIVLAEIRKRNLPTELINVVEAHNEPQQFVEIELLSTALQELPCPVCGSDDYLLNGSIITVHIGAIWFSSTDERLWIACPDCLDKKMNAADQKTILLGWWDLPFGIINTIQALRQNGRFGKQHHAEGPNQTMINFIVQNAVALTVYKDAPDQLTLILRQQFSRG